MLSLLFYLTLAFAGSECAKVKKVRGTARLIQEGFARKVSKGQVLPCGNYLIVEKKSKVVLQMGASRFAVNQNSRFRIRPPQRSSRPTRIDLLYGQMRGLYKKNKDSSSGLEVRTPTAVAGVRGTDFVISFDPNLRVTRHTTLSGEVLLQLLASGESALIKAGQSLVMNEPPPTRFMIASKGKSKETKPALVQTPTQAQTAEQMTQELSFD